MVANNYRSMPSYYFVMYLLGNLIIDQLFLGSINTLGFYK